jgi:hypothetical protein
VKKIVVNSIIEMLNEDGNSEKLYRVLWVDGEQNVVLMNISDPKKMELPKVWDYQDLVRELDEKRSIISQIEIDMRLLSPEEEYLEKFIENRNRRWELIKEIVVKEPDIYISAERGKLIRQLHESSGKSIKVIVEYLKKYWFYGKSKNGLLDNYFGCGRPGESRVYAEKPGPKSSNKHIVTEGDLINFEQSIKIFHVRKGMNLKKTHERMRETFYKRGYYRKYGVRVPMVDSNKAPSLRQFLYVTTKITTLLIDTRIDAEDAELQWMFEQWLKMPLKKPTVLVRFMKWTQLVQMSYWFHLIARRYWGNLFCTLSWTSLVGL